MPFDVEGALKAGYSAAQIADELASSHGFDIGGARKAGYTDDQIIQELQDGPPPAGDTSLASALRYGAAGAARGVGATMETAGQLLERNGAPEWGKAVESAGGAVSGAVSPPQDYSPAAPAARAALKAGNYGAALSYLPRLAVESAPDMGASLAADAVGGPAATAAYLAARSAGENAQARAANNGRQAPTTADVLASLPGTALQTALGTYGLGKAGPVGKAIDAAPAVARPLARAAVDAVGYGGADVAQQIGDTLGTDKGVQFDPAEAVVAAAQGGAARLASEVPGAVRAGVKAGSDRAMSSMIGSPDDPNLRDSIARVGDLYDAALAGAPEMGGDGQAVTPTAALNNVKSTLVGRLQTFLSTAKDNGWLDADQTKVVKAAIDQAQRHNNTITEAADGDPASTFDLVQQMSLPDDIKGPLVNGIRDLNTVSTQSFLKNSTGPFQKIGGIAGQVAGIGEGFATGGLGGALTGALFHGATGKIGALVGRGIDRVIGTDTQPILLQRMAVQRALQRAGVTDYGGNTLGRLDAAQAPLGDQQAALLHQLGGVAPAPDTSPWTQQGITQAQWNAQQNQQEAAGRQMEQQLVAQYVAKQKALSALKQRAAQGDADFNVLADKEQARMDANAAKAAVLKQKQTDAAWTQNNTARASAQTAANQVDAAYQNAAATLTKAQGGQENAMWNNQASQARQMQGQTQKRVNAVTQSQVRAHMSSMASIADRNGAIRKQLSASNGESGPTTPSSPTAALQKAAKAPKAFPAPAAAPDAGAPPVVPPAASGAHPPGFGEAPPEGARPLGGWMANVHMALKGHGIDAHASDIVQAMQHMVQNGAMARMFPDAPATAATAILAHGEKGGEMHGDLAKSFMNTVVAQVAKNKGKLGNIVSPSGASGALPEGIAARARAQQAAQGGASGIRNVPAYQHNLRQEHAIAANIVTQNPHLAPVVNAMRNPEANGKTKAGRKMVMEQHIRAMPADQQGHARAILVPLAGFGQG